MSDLIKRLRSQDVVDFTPGEIDELTDEAADALEAANARISGFERILDGLPQEAIDGGWTARGISEYAKKLEADMSFQKKVTDAARQHQAELLERAENAEDRVAGLEAARTPYASEFAPDTEGLPDVGNIHANIRSLNAQIAAAVPLSPEDVEREIDMLGSNDAAHKMLAALGYEWKGGSWIAAAEKQEPVAEVIKWRTFTGHTAWDFKVFDKTLEHGAKLYTRPLPSDAEGWRKDAERYRWLRNESNNTYAWAPMAFNCNPHCVIEWDQALHGEGLDRAVDAALAKQPEGQ